jgi:predicted acetyltransferase
MLRQALQTLKEKGIDRVLVTCNEDNIASAGVIRKNGGVYENSEWDDEDQSMTQRYWIEND